MKNFRLNAVVALILSAGLFAGCGDSKDTSKMTREFIENCKGRVEATFHQGNWNTYLDIKCLDAEWYASK